ncbi:MAG: diguanylate cyclase, partial [Chromatocurvus sp.]
AAGERGENGRRGLFRRRVDGDTERFVTLFSTLLRRLVDHIDVMNGHQLRSQNLREGLAQLTDLSKAETLLGDVTQEIDSIDARIRQERHQASDFLGTLRDRLDGFEQVVSEVSLSGLRSVERSEDLQSRVGDDVSDIGSAVRTSDGVQVNRLIESSLAKITERLASHVTEEREQYREAQQRVVELTDRLSTLESEADDLRSEIRNKSDLAIKDALTGAYNRAGYDERSAEFHARWSRSGADLSLVFIDCNKFKEINDTYGHGAGDLVLTKVADILQARARASDVVCRYGGDEFIILAPDTDCKGAEVLARSVCEEVLEAGFNDNGRPLDVSISCGVTQLKVGDSMDAALSRADEAMYEAKKLQKRIRVVALP